MDTIYQAIKNFLNSFVNLFVAIVELLAGLINGLASVLLKLRPGTDGVKNKYSTDKAAINNAEKPDEELVCKVRSELKQKITDRDTYILVRAETEVFERSRIKKAFAGRKKKMVNAITGILLEEEFKNVFSNGEAEVEIKAAEDEEVIEPVSEPVEVEEASVEKAKIQSICEVGKEAIS